MEYPHGIIKKIDPLNYYDEAIRFVVFIDESGTLEISSIDLVTKILKYKSYFIFDGGVTLNCKTLKQKEFIFSCLKLLKNCGIKTYIETKDFDNEIMVLVNN